MSNEEEKILKELQAAVDLAIELNHKGLQAGQTLYVDFAGSVSEPVAQAFLQRYKQAGWRRVCLYEDKTEAGKTVIELAAKAVWRSFLSSLFGA